MAFGQDFLKGFFGSDYLKDYKHASRTFDSAGGELLPRQKYLFHVVFTLNTSEIPQLSSVFAGENPSTLSLLVKSVDLPSYQIETETLNQYNRKRIVQSKIEYQPVRLIMHDDSKDLSRQLWYNYMQYYYKDSTHSYAGAPASDLSQSSTPAGFDYNDRDIYNVNRQVNDWGFVGETFGDSTGTFNSTGKPAFFRDIQIFGMSQKKFAQYVLINPIITQYDHDSYDYNDEGTPLENTMTIEYETVKYREGAINGASGAPIPGFANPSYYDNEPSSLARPGSTQTILGPSGLVDAGAGIINDLASGNFAGALQKGGRAFQTFKGADLGAMLKSEGRDAITGTLRGVNNRGGFQFPTVGSSSSTNKTSTGPLSFLGGDDD